MNRACKGVITLGAVLALIGSGCSAPTMTTDAQSGTAGSIYAEALAFAQTEHPEAVLVGFNNHAPTFDRVSLMPDNPDTSADMPYWSYIFAESPALLEDGVVNDDDVFAVEFVPGELLFRSFAQTRDATLGNSYATGDYLLEVDTDELIGMMMKEIELAYGEKPEVAHININARPMSIEMTVFTSAEEGFDTIYDPVNKTFSGIRGVEFVVL